MCHFYNAVNEGIENSKLVDIHGEGLWRQINWAFENWYKFQFMQLFESSFLSNQNMGQVFKEIEKDREMTIEATQLLKKPGYSKISPRILSLMHIMPW